MYSSLDDREPKWAYEQRQVSGLRIRERIQELYADFGMGQGRLESQEKQREPHYSRDDQHRSQGQIQLADRQP
jgi:hypothetical protein